MKIFYLLIFLSFFFAAHSATYYFSANSGDDSRSQDEAQNPATPWQTLKKLNSFFSSLQPGDAMLLKRGETYFGSIIVNKSGAAGSPITIGDYGSGEKPIITSLISLSDWVSKGKGIWECNNSSLASTVNTVILNNAEQELGRYPNSNDYNKGYLNFESHIGTESITDNELTSKTDWTGAELVLRSRRWILERDLITDLSGNKISYKATSNYAPYDNQGYFIQSDIRTLDKFGEWYYNSSAQKLSVFFGDSNPSSYDIEVPSADNLIYSFRFSNITFTNLNIKGSNICGINIKGGLNIRIENCDINFSGQNGVKVTSHTNFTIEGSTIYNSNNNGIDLGYSGDNAVIRNNKIMNTALFPGMVGSGDGKGIGIFSSGNGSIIEYNEIRNTGYTAINFNGDNVIVKNNLIDSYCMIKDDGGGIYSTKSASASATNRKVIGNIILNGIGAGEGTSNPAYFPAEGIYLDNNASNIEIDDNTIANGSNNGVFIHNAYGIILNKNTIYNNVRQLDVIEDPDNSRIRSCAFTSNLFFSKLPSQIVSNIRASAEDITLFGNFNNNCYARPLDDRLSIFNSYVNGNGNRISESFDLQGWKNKYGQDKDSKITAKQIAPYILKRLIGSNRVDNGNFTASIIDTVIGNLCTPAWSNSGMLDGGYLKVDPEARGSSVSINIGGIKEGKNYILKYSVRGSVDSSMTIGAFLRHDGGDYARLTPIQYRKVSTARSDNEMLFSSLNDDSSVTVVLKADQQNTFYLDNIQLYEADATVTNPDDSLRFEYNASTSNKIVSLDGSYIDAKDKKYSNSITLAPYTSAILIKISNDNTSPDNQPPTVSITSPDNGKKFSGSQNISIAANASDDDGSIAKVEFYNDTTLLATEKWAPYTFSWENVPDGNYTITAKATDNQGLSSSDIVHVIVGSANEAPLISLTSPGNNTNYSGPAVVKINADASDSNGTIVKVDFYNGFTLLHSETSAPYTYTWLDVPDGTYSVTAKATDNEGLETTSGAVNVTVGHVKGAPVVNIISPTTDSSFTSPAIIRLVADAYDTDGTVTKVEFYNGSELLHTEYKLPYTYTWNDVQPGSYHIVAVATDSDGNVTTSDIVNLFVSPSDTNTIASRPAANSSNSSNLYGFSNKFARVKLSPNPARDILNIATSGFQQNEKVTITILSASGIIVKTMKPAVTLNQIVQADVSSLSNGIYFVKVVSGNTVLNQRFVKL